MGSFNIEIYFNQIDKNKKPKKKKEYCIGVGICYSRIEMPIISNRFECVLFVEKK